MIKLLRVQNSAAQMLYLKLAMENSLRGYSIVHIANWAVPNRQILEPCMQQTFFAKNGLLVRGS